MLPASASSPEEAARSLGVKNRSRWHMSDLQERGAPPPFLVLAAPGPGGQAGQDT